MIRCMIAEDYETLNNIFYNIINYEKDMDVVFRASSGKELYEQVVKEQPDVILMDVEMETPLAGVEYSSRILAKYPDVRIIILTCHEDEEIIIKAYEAGVVDYVLKDNSSSEILEAIRAAYNDTSPIRSYAANAIRKQLKEIGSYKNSLLSITNILSTLTISELDVLRLLLDGKKQKEIAKVRHVELSTVKFHVSSILKKFKCKRATEVINTIKDLNLEALFQEQ
ncbi:response regulator transcription factor [Vallitalea okinawensis]|uniref:response regulator transcription factor n=1 Tax=Vallitalea okinawensis TaxID=2078660 RepID=UPI000CFDC701|nr:response regulator transcription factor [Vallitalea okinawensis]